MAYTYHGITAWTRVGNGIFLEDSSGLKTAQINYQCAGITTTPPFIEGQSLPSPFAEYVVYPNPSISIGSDGISSCLVLAYSANTTLKQDEKRGVVNQVSGVWVDTLNMVDRPLTVNVIAYGGFVRDAQFTNQLSVPTSAFTYNYEITSARVPDGAVVTNGIELTGAYEIVSYNQENKGSVTVVEAIYATNIFSAYTAGPIIYI